MANLTINELQQEILRLKKEKNAMVFAHYYQRLEVQDVADKVCDSFQMAKLAMESDADIIVICGVHFMAESAKILNPSKKVLIPVPDAGCPMADMVTPEDVLKLRAEHPNAAVMCYVNSSAAVKAVSDICCTSSSAIRVAKSLDAKEIIFVPDMHLGKFTSLNVPEKEFIFHNGFCPTHHKIKAEDVLAAKAAHPGAKFTVHPECRDEVVALADHVGSTAEIIDYVRSTDAEEFIIGTEEGIIDRLRRELPNKKIFAASASFVCPNMKKTHLEDLYECLRDEKFEIKMTDDEISKAKQSLDRMVRV
jgi:quinolinate synthase